MAMINFSQEKRLASRINALLHRIKITEQLPVLRQDKQEKLLTEAMRIKANRFAPELLMLERATYPSKDLFAEENSKKLGAFQRKQTLHFRAFRQSLYREEKLLDKDYKPTGPLSKENQGKLDAFEQSTIAKYEAFYHELEALYLQKNPEKTPSQRKEAKQAYKARKGEVEDILSQEETKLRAQEASKLADYQRSVDERLAKLKARHAALVKALEAYLKDKQTENALTLPEDVVLRVENLSMHFGGLKAVDELTFDVKKNEIFGLIGPNGAGKTTVFNCITQFYKATHGSLLYRTPVGRVVSLNNYAVHDVIKLGIVRTFQNVELIPELTVLENLLIAAHTQFKTSYFAHMVNSNEARREELILRKKAQGILDYLRLTEVQNVPPVGLPYGLLKRIELARTLMSDAKLIILDEPAAGLNEKESDDLADMIKKIAKEYQVTIFLVEHDMGLVMDVCDHICAISFGRKLAYGTPKEIQSDPVVQEAYLGSEG